MLNNDMIANCDDPQSEWQYCSVIYDGYEFFYYLSELMRTQYTCFQEGTIEHNGSASDSFPFYVRGFPSFYYHEREFSPVYHSIEDVIENCNIPYCTELGKLNAAMVVSMDMIPPMISGLTLYDEGTGNSVMAEWDASPDPLLGYYKLFYGNMDLTYVDSLETNDTSCVIEGLQENTEYFIGVQVVTEDGVNGEFTYSLITPLSIPRIPENFYVEPQWGGINITWQDNIELDFDGYNLYRSHGDEENFTLLNSQLIGDNYYFDETPIPGDFYFYRIEAVDDDGNSSGLSASLRSRVVSMHQGILLVDDTYDGNGTFMNPAHADITDYYDQLLGNFNYSYFYTHEEDAFRIDDLCAYSTVFLIIDNNSNHALSGNSINEIRRYLDFGGKIIISGFKPMAQFCDLVAYPTYFTEGDFAYDYLKLQAVEYNNMARFNMAVSVFDSVMGIEVDQQKAPENLDYHLIGVEALIPGDQSVNHFIYGNGYDPGSAYNQMNDLPVSAFYNGEDNKVLLLGFPLYYMDFDASRDFIQLILQNYYDEVGIDEELASETVTCLTSKNFPNPFNPSTRISFFLAENNKAVKLDIFNLKGQKVKELINSPLDTGNHEVIWNGDDKEGRIVTSGIYFYKLQTDKNSVIRKMIMIK